MTPVSSKNFTRVNLPISEKLEEISQAAEHFGIGKTTSHMSAKCEEEYKEMNEVNQKMGSIRMHKLRKTELFPVNVRTWEWLKEAKERGEPISNKLIKEKALSFAHDESVFNFSASNGWLTAFKRRHGVRITRSSSSSSHAHAITNIESSLCAKEKVIARKPSHAVKPIWRRFFPEELLKVGLPKPEKEKLKCFLPHDLSYLL